MNQISGLLFFLSIIFISLEIKVKEETDIAMKPFRAAREEAEKQKEVKEAGLPKPAKDAPEKASNKKKNNKAKSGGGKEGDFRVGLWGQLRSEIIEKEKAQKLEARNDPYSLDYLTKIGNFEVIARYMFAQNHLSGGCYILLGSPIENLEEAKQAARLKVGDPCPSWVKLDFSYYEDLACQVLNSAAVADNFFYEMYISMASQMGPPKATALEELENAISRKEKIESVLANERILTYTWETARSTVNFYFACLDSRPYFRLEYLSNKELMRGN